MVAHRTLYFCLALLLFASSFARPLNLFGKKVKKQELENGRKAVDQPRPVNHPTTGFNSGKVTVQGEKADGANKFGKERQRRIDPYAPLTTSKHCLDIVNKCRQLEKSITASIRHLPKDSPSSLIGSEHIDQVSKIAQYYSERYEQSKQGTILY